MRQEYHCRVEDILFERDGVQKRLASTPLRLSGPRNALKATPEQLEQHPGHSAASHLQLESLFAPSVSRFFDKVAGIVSDKVAAHRARLVDVCPPVSVIMELYFGSILELPRAWVMGRTSTARPETSGRPYSLPLGPRSDRYAGNSCMPVFEKCLL